MKRDKKTGFLIALISFLLLISTVQDTYSKYRSEASGETNISIARWNIIVNNQDIISNNQINNVLTPIFLNNSNVADGVIAPGAVGYFDLNIDATNVDVSFNYSLITSINAESAVSDLIVVGYTIDGGAMNNVGGMITDYDETILLDAQNKTRTIRLYIKWDDSSSNNVDDTIAALSDGKAKMNVLINFSQVIN